MTDVAVRSPWQAEQLDLDAYLCRIGVAAEPPSRAALDPLDEAHLRAFTFDRSTCCWTSTPASGQIAIT